MTQLQAFELSSVEDIDRFEKLLFAYVEREAAEMPAFFTLVEAYKYLQDDPDGARLFTSLLDIQISIALLWCDVIVLGGQFNRTTPARMAERKSPFPEAEAFRLRMRMHQSANGFVFRFRSLWDKLMGLFVLRFVPERYDWFCSAKSKKAAFRKIMAAHDFLAPGLVETASQLVQGFDDLHRTAEAHGTGTLRKVSFSWTTAEDSPAVKLLGYWNFVCETAHAVGRMFNPSRRSQEVH